MLPFSPLIVFMLGVIVQTIILIVPRNKDALLYFFGSMIAALFAALFIEYLLASWELSETRILVGIIMFILMTSIFFREKILPVINERTLVVWNSVIVYIYFSNIQNMNIFGLTLLVGTVVTLCMVAMKFNFGFLLKIFLYSWYLCMVILFGITQFTSGFINILSDFNTINAFSANDAFINGMVFMFVLSHIIYLFAFIPLPSKYKSFTERLEEVKKHARIISSKYSSEQISLKTFLLLITLLSVIFIINSMYVILSPFLLSSFILLFNQALEKNEKEEILPIQKNA